MTVGETQENSLYEMVSKSELVESTEKFFKKIFFKLTNALVLGSISAFLSLVVTIDEEINLDVYRLLVHLNNAKKYSRGLCQYF